MIEELIGYAASILIGLVLGLLGGGGSILSIPILVYFFDVDPVMASAYSLFIVGVTSLAGAIPKYRQQLVNLRMGILFGIPSIISTFLTRLIVVPAIPEIVFQFGDTEITRRMLILGLFAILMVLASIPMIRGRGELTSNNKRFRIVLVTIEGIVIGFLTGLVGAGGGFLIIPALVLLTGLRFKTAAGTSLFIIAVNSLTGFIGDLFHHTMNWNLLLTITALAIVGIFVGNKLSGRIQGTTLRKAFGWFTLGTGTYMIVRELL